MHDTVDQTPHAQLNLRGLHCPIPILRCKAALQRLTWGELLQVTTDNLDATRDLLLLLERGGAHFLGWRHDDHGFHFLIQRQASQPRPQMTLLLAPRRLRRLRGWLGFPSAEAC